MKHAFKSIENTLNYAVCPLILIGKKEHTSHVSCKVEDVVAAFHNLLAVVVDAKIHQVELITKDLLLRREAGSAGFLLETSKVLSVRERSTSTVAISPNQTPPIPGLTA